ncbi:MAG: ATP-binding protein [Saprospiraceae bacterium]|nr:ATP-binding protein [Saprospiraceae bacterium]
MSLRIQYILYILLLHFTIAGLMFYIFQDDRAYFILSELGLLISLMVSFRFYRRFNQPLTLMKYGVDAIKDEDYNVRFLRTGSESINELIDVFNTFLEKLKIERVKTQEQAYLLESIIEASPISMIMLDYDDLITSTNNAAKKIFNKKNVESEMSFFEINHPLIAPLKNMTIGQKKIISTGSTTKYNCQINSIIHLGFKRKFIMIEELTKELLENEKAAYGKVIRMMAHEVNNSMGAINSILQSVIDFAFDEEEDEYKESLIIAKERNDELALFMKNFADVIRLPPPLKERVDLRTLGQRSQMIMTQLAESEKIEISLSLPDVPVYIFCDVSQIQQVLINAIKNSIESIGNKGKITILLNQKAPQITITDNGRGISNEAKMKLFSPFFSTKPTGQGIGLIISRDILLAHKAEFELYTDGLSELTHFEISFQN